jgi:hypothetical protein
MAARSGRELAMILLIKRANRKK